MQCVCVYIGCTFCASLLTPPPLSLFLQCTVSNANGITKTQVYYPRPRSYSAGSQNTTVASNKRLSAPITSTSTSSGAPTTPTMKVVRINAKLYGKAKSLEEGKKALGSPTGSIGSNGGGSSSTMRYKTELCRPFQENGFCKYGDKCQFAHGEHDLRSLPRHPKYKTELCRTYHTRGFCPYGLRCHFIHHIDETRKNIEGGCGGVPKSPTKQRSFSFNMPLSPSLDSGISSPDDYQRGKYFEFPIGGDHNGSGSGSSGSSGSEGEFRDFEHSFEQDVVTSGGGCVPPSYRPLHQQDSITSPDPFLDLDMNSVGSDSPLKPLPDDFTMEAYSMQELMSQITLEETTTTTAAVAAAASATTACCSSSPHSSSSPSSSSVLQQQQQQQGRCRSNSSNSGHRLPVFDDMLNTRSDSALLEGNLNSNQSPSHLGSFFGAM